MQISYTLLRGQTAQVREVITNILATQLACVFVVYIYSSGEILSIDSAREEDF